MQSLAFIAITKILLLLWAVLQVQTGTVQLQSRKAGNNIRTGTAGVCASSTEMFVVHVKKDSLWGRKNT